MNPSSHPTTNTKLWDMAIQTRNKAIKDHQGLHQELTRTQLDTPFQMEPRTAKVPAQSGRESHQRRRSEDGVVTGGQSGGSAMQRPKNSLAFPVFGLGGKDSGEHSGEETPETPATPETPESREAPETP